MSRPIHIVRLEFVFSLFVKFFRVIERYNLISAPMHNVDGALDVGNAVDVGEFVEGESPSQVKNYS